MVSDLPPVDLVVDARQSTHRRVEVAQTSVPQCRSSSAGASGTGFSDAPGNGRAPRLLRTAKEVQPECAELRQGKAVPLERSRTSSVRNAYSRFWDVRHRRWELCCRRRVQVPGDVVQVHDDGAVLVHVVAEVNSHGTPSAGGCPGPSDGSTRGQTRAIGRAQTKPLRKLPSAGGEMPGSVSAVAGPVQPCRVEGLPWENVRSAGRS